MSTRIYTPSQRNARAIGGDMLDIGRGLAGYIRDEVMRAESGHALCVGGRVKVKERFRNGAINWTVE
jgi:hypothetical protein